MILLMGVAGAGKSMQGRILADEHGYAWISTGEILRVIVTGKRRREMLEGKLLSDAELIELLSKIFDYIDTTEEFVLDGFPRTIPQADWLIDQVKKGRFRLSSVINLVASREVVEKRLMNRGRLDDTSEAIAKRFMEHERVTQPILKHLLQEHIPIFNIDADRDARTIHDEILSLIDNPTPLAS